MPRIAALTSGGDAPGMNDAVRAITRRGIDLGWEVVGVQKPIGVNLWQLAHVLVR